MTSTILLLEENFNLVYLTHNICNRNIKIRSEQSCVSKVNEQR